MGDISKGSDIHTEQHREGQGHDRLVKPFLDCFRDFWRQAYERQVGYTSVSLDMVYAPAMYAKGPF